jgi:hypothetical protein
MKKHKLFIFLSIITSVLIFGVAATYNLCGASVDFGETTHTTEEVYQKQISQAEQTQQESSEQQQQVEEAVEVELEVDEEPISEEVIEEDVDEEENTDIVDFAPIDEDEPENHPPEIFSMAVIDRGAILSRDIDYLYTDMEYHIRVEFTDLDAFSGDTFFYVWSLGWGAEDYGYIVDPNAQATTWVTPSNPVEEVWLLVRVVDASDAYDEAERQFRIVVGSGI